MSHPELLDDDSKVLAGVCHLGNVLGPFTLITFLVSIILYLVKSKEGNKELNFQAKQAFIFCLAEVVIGIVFGVLSFIITLVTMGLGACIVAPIGIILGLAIWGYSIYLTVVTFMGKNVQIPIIAEWADKFGE